MSTIWFTSDTHFLHKKLANEIRGFDSLQEHDEALVANYNSVIGSDDTVFHLGDFSLKNPVTNMDYFKNVMSRLNGEWHLVAGNHDSCWPGHRDSHKFQRTYLDLGFASVQAFAKRKLDGQYILMSHFPYKGDHTVDQRFTQFRLRNEGEVLLHGHTHSDKKVSLIPYVTGNDVWGNKTLQIHVGLDAWNLMPVSVDQVLAVINEEKAK